MEHTNTPTQVHPDGGAGAEAPLSPLDSPFTPGGPLSTRTPRTDAALQAAASARTATGGVNSTTKYGELPPCVKASARALLASAVVVGELGVSVSQCQCAGWARKPGREGKRRLIITHCACVSYNVLPTTTTTTDLDRDCVTEPRRGDPSSGLPPLPEGAAAALLTAVQRIVNPTLEGAAGCRGGYGFRAVQAAREAALQCKAQQQQSSSKGGGGGKRAGTRTPTPRKAKGPEGEGQEEGGEAAPHPNQLLHGAFAGFFREAVLDRYREFTLSHLEEQVVAFHADAFLAAQPEGSHAFWGDFFQTRLFAHFLLLEHRRVADTFQAPPALLPPRPAT